MRRQRCWHGNPRLPTIAIFPQSHDRRPLAGERRGPCSIRRTLAESKRAHRTIRAPLRVRRARRQGGPALRTTRCSPLQQGAAQAARSPDRERTRRPTKAAESHRHDDRIGHFDSAFGKRQVGKRFAIAYFNGIGAVEHRQSLRFEQPTPSEMPYTPKQNEIGQQTRARAHPQNRTAPNSMFASSPKARCPSPRRHPEDANHVALKRSDRKNPLTTNQPSIQITSPSRITASSKESHTASNADGQASKPNMRTFISI